MDDATWSLCLAIHTAFPASPQKNLYRLARQGNMQGFWTVQSTVYCTTNLSTLPSCQLPAENHSFPYILQNLLWLHQTWCDAWCHAMLGMALPAEDTSLSAHGTCRCYPQLRWCWQCSVWVVTCLDPQTTHKMQVTKMLTSPPEQLIYRLRSFLFSLSKYSIVATSWLPVSSSIAFPRKMILSRYCTSTYAD